jgi:hypothetical protein
MNPRKPTNEEKKELVTYILFDEFGKSHVSKEDKENVEGLVEQAAIAVFDDYITDSPGYAGKVMVVVWSGDPAYSDTYIWDREYENGKVNIPVLDARSPEEGHYITKIRRVKMGTDGE